MYACYPAVWRLRKENLDPKASLGLASEFKAILDLLREDKASNKTACGGKFLPLTCRELRAPGCVCVSKEVWLWRESHGLNYPRLN